MRIGHVGLSVHMYRFGLCDTPLCESQSSLQSKVNFGKILATILGSYLILLGFLSVTGDDYNLFRNILATVYAYSADWVTVSVDFLRQSATYWWIVHYS